MIYKDIDTYEEHKKVEEAQGFVWWGKFGLGISSRIAKIASKQIKDGINTYLFLAKASNILHQAEIIDILGGGEDFRSYPEDPEVIPAYYRDEKCSAWFKIKNIKPVNNKSLKTIKLFNQPMFPPELTGMRSLIYVTLRQTNE